MKAERFEAVLMGPAGSFPPVWKAFEHGPRSFHVVQGEVRLWTGSTQGNDAGDHYSSREHKRQGIGRRGCLGEKVRDEHNQGNRGWNDSDRLSIGAINTSESPSRLRPLSFWLPEAWFGTELLIEDDAFMAIRLLLDLLLRAASRALLTFNH